MKLCYVANSRFPSERAHMTQIVQMCNAFVEHGHEVTLLVTTRKTSIMDSPSEYYGVPIRFHIERVSVPDIAGVSPHIPTPLHPYAFFIQRFVFAMRSLLFLRNRHFDFVFGRDEGVLLLFTYVLKTHIVWESHEAKFSLIAKTLLSRIRALIVISEGIRDFYTVHGVPLEKMLVAHDAVDARFFAPHCAKSESRRMLGITTPKSVVMYIGGLDVWKGVETLFSASRGQDSFEVYVIGGKEHELQMYTSKYPHIHFLGFLPYKELPMYQQASDVLVIPNTAQNAVSAEYTSPLKLFAYMTSRRPIVASRIPSITNILSEEDAFFCTADDGESLQSALQTVLEHPQEAQEKAERAYTKSLGYTWKKRAGEILNFLQKSH